MNAAASADPAWNRMLTSRSPGVSVWNSRIARIVDSGMVSSTGTLPESSWRDENEDAAPGSDRGEPRPVGRCGRQPSERGKDRVDCRRRAQVIDDPGPQVRPAAEDRGREPALAGPVQRRAEKVRVAVQRSGIGRLERGCPGPPARDVPEADDREVRGTVRDRFQVVALRDPGREVRGEIVVHLHEPSQAGRPEVLPACPELEGAKPPRPLEAVLVPVDRLLVRVAVAVVLRLAVERLPQVLLAPY